MTSNTICLFVTFMAVVCVNCSPSKDSQTATLEDTSTEDLLSKTDTAQPDSAGYYSAEHRDEIQETTKILYQRDISQAQSQQLYLAEIDLLPFPGDPIKPSSAALTDTLKTIQRCLTYDDAPETVQKTFQFKNLRLRPQPNFIYTIPLAFHIIQTPVANCTDRELNVQVDSLNRAYRSAGIQFVIGHVCRKVNSAWDACFPTDKHPATNNAFVAMTNQLSVNHMSSINIFINDLPALGIATFPWDIRRHNTKQDVIVINFASLSGRTLQTGSQSMAMEGNTLVHELGHFLGLFHTFHFESQVEYSCDDLTNYDGCSIGDDVADTPPQRICHFNGCGDCEGDQGCDPCQAATTCNTCNDNEGNDPVENYMGYNPDACMKKFTSGQNSRIRSMLHSSVHRRHLITRSIPPINP